MKLVILTTLLTVLFFADGARRSFWNDGARYFDDVGPFSTGGGSRRLHHYIEEKYFRQKLDHVDPADKRFFYQRYYMDPSYYNNSGRVFLLTCGAGFIRWDMISDAYEYSWVMNAKHFGAFRFLLEHRYHGKSNATIDASTPNLKWLTIGQALRDIANFIQGMNDEYLFPNPKWILFGCSYGGALAAWARLKLPYLVTGAVASSATIVAKVNFFEYLNIVRKDLDAYSTDCVNNLMRAARDIEHRIANRYRLRETAVMFRACESYCDLTKCKDASTLLFHLAMNLAFVAQYDGVNQEPYSSNLTVAKVCDIVNDVRHGDFVQRYAAAVQYILNELNAACNPCSYDDYIASYKNYRSEDNTDRLHAYLSDCSQLGFLFTSDVTYRSPFTHRFPARYFFDWCKDIFGAEFTSQRLSILTKATNVMLGGKNFEGTNVVFVIGLKDPYHPVCITKPASNETTVIFLHGTSHCADFLPARAQELPELVHARRRIREEIAKWIR